MEWVRTECGIILKRVDGNCWIDFDRMLYNKKIQDNRFVKEQLKEMLFSEIGDDFLIKNQGDSLIDVLEYNDLVYCEKYHDWYFFVDKVNEFEFAIDGEPTTMKFELVTKVITHEQYMSHAQIIKEK